MHPILLESLARQRHQTMVENARKHHIHASYDVVYCSMLERVTVAVGNALILWGERLKDIYCDPVSKNDYECGEKKTC